MTAGALVMPQMSAPGGHHPEVGVVGEEAVHPGGDEGPHPLRR